MGGAFCGWIEAVLCSQDFDLIGNISYTDICSRDSIAGHKQSKRSLRSINDNILTQVINGQRCSGSLHTHKQGLGFEGLRQAVLQTVYSFKRFSVF